MTSRSRLLTIAFLVMVSFLNACCSVQSAPSGPQDSTVRIELWTGSDIQFAASGVVIHSSEQHGTFVLTNAHCVSIDVEHPVYGKGIRVIAQVIVEFSDGSRRHGMTLPWVSYGETQTEHGIDREDLALLYIPYEDKQYRTITGFSKDGISRGELVYTWTLTPRDYRHKKTGIGLEDGQLDYTDASTMDPRVEQGNSGSPVYEEATGLLAGILWGRGHTDKTGDHIDIAYVIETDKIVELLDKNGLRYLLR